MLNLLKDKNVFIVEDNVQNRVIFQMALIRYGAFVHFERSGRGTIHSLTSISRIDVIVLDLMLADNISGFDIYDEIRQLPKYAATPIVAASAMDPAIAIPRAREKGFSGFIAKPIQAQLFARQIASIIEGEKVWHTGGRGGPILP